MILQRKTVSIIPYLDFCHCKETNIYLLPLQAFSVGFLLLETYTISKKKVHQARLKNMLVCCYLGLLFWVHPVGQKYVFFFHLKMEKIALILVYLTWFSNSSLGLISCVYFFCNVRATIMNLTYFNSHNLQLADLHETTFPRLSLSSLHLRGWDGWMGTKFWDLIWYKDTK